tara:strand:- start:8421 stop:9470 length:1050 start_codon:yes stop_codon:yes gene_type:complete
VELSKFQKKVLTIWLATGAVMVFLMVAIGGITRLTHSGLSMTDWNLIVGSIPPVSDQEWNESFKAYQNFPEFKELNYNFSLEDYKSIFWWEYLHRLLGRVLGIVFLIPFLAFMAKRWFLGNKKLRNQLLVVFALGAFQAFLGWFMVKSGLVDVPRVSHYRLSAHLLTAFITCLYILWIIFEINVPRTKNMGQLFSFGKQIRLLLLLTLIQAVYGAFVAGLQAGLVHNTWPLMDGEIVSSAVFAMDPVYLNFVMGKSGVQFVHRMLAIIIFVWVAVIYVKGVRRLTDPLQLQALRLMLIFVLVQFGLGIITLLLRVPIELGVLHQMGALLLLSSLVFAYHRFTPPSIEKK